MCFGWCKKCSMYLGVGGRWMPLFFQMPKNFPTMQLWRLFSLTILFSSLLFYIRIFIAAILEGWRGNYLENTSFHIILLSKNSFLCRAFLLKRNSHYFVFLLVITWSWRWSPFFFNESASKSRWFARAKFCKAAFQGLLTRHASVFI